MKTSVCITVHNEEKNISFVIQSILHQKLSEAQIEIFIVSSGSTDKTNNLILAHCNDGAPIILIIEPVRSGKASAINLAIPYIKNSGSEICFFSDGDVHIPDFSFQNIISKFEVSKHLSVVTGHPLPRIKKNDLWEKIAEENCNIWDDVRKKQSDANATWALSGYLFAVKTANLPDEIPVNLAAEDAFLGLLLLMKNNKMGYETTALVYVKFPNNIHDYYDQKSRTRSGWQQLQTSSPFHLHELRKLQRKVIFSRFYNGNPISIICFLIDNIIWVLDKHITSKKLNRHIWKPIESTK